MIEEINKRKNNIGSLCCFIKNNEEYLDVLNVNIIDISKYKLSIIEKLYYYFNNINEPILCICGKHRKYKSFKFGFYKTCGNKKCIKESTINTNLKLFGVDNPMKNDAIKNKSKETILEKYNGEHYMKDDIIKTKHKNTLLKNYGVDSPLKSNEIKNKVKNKWKNKTPEEIEQLNKKESSKNAYIKNKKEILKKKNNTIINKYGSYENFYKIKSDNNIKTVIKKYNVSNVNKDKTIKNKSAQTYIYNKNLKIKKLLPEHIIFLNKKYNQNNTDSYIKLYCKKCNKEFYITRQLLYKRHTNNTEICLICNKKNNGISELEIEIYNFIKNNYNGKILTSNKKIISPYELDIYLPDIKLALEINGLYWHCDLCKHKYYHYTKSNLCDNKKIKLIHIWEHDWIFKQDIVKSIILNQLNNKKLINIDKYNLVKISKIEMIEFLNINYIDDVADSNHNIGIYNNNELIFVFSYKKYKDVIKLFNICNKTYYNINNILENIIMYLNKEYSIVNYGVELNRNYDNIKMYLNSGFIIEKYIKPKFKYITNKLKKYKIYDSGKIKLNYKLDVCNFTKRLNKFS